MHIDVNPSTWDTNPFFFSFDRYKGPLPSYGGLYGMEFATTQFECFVNETAACWRWQRGHALYVPLQKVNLTKADIVTVREDSLKRGRSLLHSHGRSELVGEQWDVRQEFPRFPDP